MSSAFKDGGIIPQKYGRDFKNIHPPLAWSHVPDGARSFALTMDDPDVPPAAGVTVWDHWIVWNIPLATREIPEAWDVVGVPGRGTRGELVYGGPRPLDREHRYYFRLYALNRLLSIASGSTKHELIAAMQHYMLAEAVLMGRFAPSTII